MRIGAAKLDADPYKINARNGTLILSRSMTDGDPIEFRPHDPKDYLTQVLGTVYDPAAQCPTYDAFLKRVHPVRFAVHVNATITAGTNSAKEKARFIELMMKSFRGVFGSELSSATYVVVEEVPAQSWGYDGRTQESRRQQAA